MNKPVVLVTGANRGIGFEICRLLALENKYTIILTSRNEASGKEKISQLASFGSDVHFFKLDVSNFESITNFVALLLNNVLSVDVLINNAGVYVDSPDLDEFPSFFDITPSILKSTFETNLIGIMLLIQQLIPLFKKNSLIINVSSGMGKMNTSDDRSGHIGYRTSKACLNAFTKSLSESFHTKNIKVVSMCPGWIQSDMGGPRAPKTVTEGAKDIITLINSATNLKNGSFLYSSHVQNL